MRNIKLDQHLIPDGIVFVVKFMMMSGTCMQKKLPKQLQWKAIVDDFCRGGQYERLEGQEGCGFFATQMNFEKPPEGGGARG